MPPLTWDEWKDRVAWSAITGAAISMASWGGWITVSLSHKADRDDSHQLTKAIQKNTEAIYALKVAIARLEP